MPTLRFDTKCECVHPIGLATKWTLPLLYSYSQWTLPSLNFGHNRPFHPSKYTKQINNELTHMQDLDNGQYIKKSHMPQNI